MEILASAAIILFESICILLFFNTFLQQRNNKNQILMNIFIVVSVGLFSFIMAVFQDNNTSFLALSIRFTSFIILFFIVCSLFYKGKMLVKLVLSICIYLLIIFVDYIFYLIIDIFSLVHFINERHFEESIVLVMIAKLLLFTLVLIIKIINNKKHNSLSAEDLNQIGSKRWLLVLFMPILSILSIWTIFSFVRPEEQSNPILLSVLLGWLFVSVVIYLVISRASENEMKHREYLVIRERMKNGKEYVANERQNYKNTDSLYHDYKHHIHIINQMLLEENYVEAMKYSVESGQVLMNIMPKIDTNNPIVNTLLNSKLSAAESKGIGFVTQINDLSYLPIADEDMVVILSNLLDNAIEACEAAATQTAIQLKLMLNNDEFILSIKNPYANKIMYKRDKIISSKPKPDFHGIGLTSTIRLIEKNKGLYAISTEDSIFQFSAILPFSMEKSNMS